MENPGARLGDERLMQAGCRPVSLEGCRLAAPWLAAKSHIGAIRTFASATFDAGATRGAAGPRPVVAAVIGLACLFQRQVLLAGGLDRLVGALHRGTSVDRGEPAL